MVSHTSVTNVTARGPLALHLSTRLGPAPVNGHRNLPGYVKNGSVSENSMPSSGQELHIPEEEHSAHTRPSEEEKHPPVVEEERETVMWPQEKSNKRWNRNWTLRMVWRGMTSTLPGFFLSLSLSPVNWARTLSTNEAQGQKGYIFFFFRLTPRDEDFQTVVANTRLFHRPPVTDSVCKASTGFLVLFPLPWLLLSGLLRSSVLHTLNRRGVWIVVAKINRSHVQARKALSALWGTSMDYFICRIWIKSRPD